MVFWSCSYLLCDRRLPLARAGVAGRAKRDRPVPAKDERREPPARQGSIISGHYGPERTLFDFRRGDALIRCELIDHGDQYGVQALFLDDGFPISCRTFPPWRNPQQTSRTSAIIWSVAERAALERILPVITPKGSSADHAIHAAYSG